MYQSPNAVANLALVLWPLVALLLVRWLGPARGMVATILGGYLLLPPPPAGLDLPLLPALTKDTIPSLSALAAVLLLARPRPRLLPEGRVARALVLLFLVSPWGTVLTNSDPVYWGRFALPALHPREAVGMAMVQAILLLPFLLGRALLAGEDGARLLLWALLWGGLAYSLPMLLEVRLSPQINLWVYGFFQHSFEQMMRSGGFRPIVFLYHGLWAAFLAMIAAAAALALLRGEIGAGRGRRVVGLAVAAGWMLMTLVLCKSLASLLYALLLAPLLLLAPRRLQLALALALAMVPLAYPAAKMAGLVPQEQILALAERVGGQERAFSLGFRFRNEDLLVARAAERPLFGWGLWSRNMVLEADTGREVTISDGRWIIVLGILGWAGLAANLGLLAWPVIAAWAAGRGAGGGAGRGGGEARDGEHGGGAGQGRGPPQAVAALALIHAVNLVDLVPNATETPLTWLLAGVLLGWVERQGAPSPAPRAAPGLAPGPIPGPLPGPIPGLIPALGPGSRRPAFETIL